MPLSLALPPHAKLVSDRTVGEVQTLTWTWAEGRLVLRVLRGVPKQDVEQLLRDRQMLFEGLFARGRSPHSLNGGERPPECPEALRPAHRPLADVRAWGYSYLVGASDDFAYGGCTTRTQSLRSAWANVYCPGHDAVIELRHFTTREGAEAASIDVLDSLRCAAGTR